MRVANRVRKLERTGLLKRQLSPLEQLQRALNDAALRLTGKDLSLFQIGEPAMELVMDEVWDSFLETLSAADLAILISELERQAEGNQGSGRGVASPRRQKGKLPLCK